jgi:hypothetical protein
MIGTKMLYTKFLLTFLILFSQFVFAGEEKHDFSLEFWSGGKSCMVCHNLVMDLPRVAPPTARIIEFGKLSDAELAAYQSNTNNLMCLVCHQAPHSPILPRVGPPNGTPMPGLPTLPTLPPIGTPSTGIINGQNQKDCLQCHDLHNKLSNKMLKEGY